MFVSEIFLSIQGESTYVGLPCVFVRLAGCNLECTWCDTEYAQTPVEADELGVDEIVREVERYGCRLVEVTGGEPFTQEGTRELTQRLLELKCRVIVETNGSVSLAGLDERVIKIIDVKCPTSGYVDSFLLENIAHITPRDEIKFVIGDRNDYEYACAFVKQHLVGLEGGRMGRFIFSPVDSVLNTRELAAWILEDRLNVRLQIQMHKRIWAGRRGGAGGTGAAGRARRD